ncbi:MAG: hypothetical protein ACRYG8_07775 [Janthinobacterium lividum]
MNGVKRKNPCKPVVAAVRLDQTASGIVPRAGPPGLQLAASPALLLLQQWAGVTGKDLKFICHTKRPFRPMTLAKLFAPHTPA